MDLKGNSTSVICLCGKSPQEQCICIRNVSVKYGLVAFYQVLWDFLIFLTTLVDIWLWSEGLFSPSLLAPLLLAPLTENVSPVWLLALVLLWQCLVVLRCAVHAGSSLGGLRLCMSDVSLGWSSLPVMGGSQLFAVRCIHDLFLWGCLELK